MHRGHVRLEIPLVIRGWLPDRNRCWFAARVVEVRRAYDLTIDRREAEVLEQILSQCTSTAMEPLVCTTQPAAGRAKRSTNGDDVLARYDDNGDGRITCKEARRHGIAPGEQGPSGLPVHAGC